MPDKIGIIAGSGQFPALFAQAARQKGLQVYAAAYINEADPDLAQHVVQLQWVYIGQINQLIKFFHTHHVTQAVMLGAIQKARLLKNFRPDIKALALIAKMRHTHDDAILRQFAGVLEKEGIQIRPSTFLLPELLAPPGIWTRRKPSRTAIQDIRIGWHIAKEIGRLDIGQCIIIGSGSVLAIEAIDGTDATIERGGRLGRSKAVAIKVCKPNQDTRFDIPSVGVKTIETMNTFNVHTLAIEAGKVVVFDRQAMIACADAYKITIIAIDDINHWD